VRPALPFACPLELHARYGSLDISSALGLTSIAQTGQTGVGVLHAPRIKAYAMLITFQKTEREFSRVQHDPALRPGREAAQRHDGAVHVSRPRRPRAARERAADQGRLAPPPSDAGGDVRDESQRWMRGLFSPGDRRASATGIFGWMHLRRRRCRDQPDTSRPRSCGVTPIANNERISRSTETVGSPASILATLDWLERTALASCN